MERVFLGDTGIKVSRLCFGSLTITPFQANLPIKEGAELIKYAYSKGVNFLDTAELYDNYDYIREALKDINRNDFVITTKCYAYDKKTAEERKFYCGRLGYETKPHYSFNCWDPKPKVKRLMEKLKREGRL
mgnify:CR=1 FL=1